jgi:homopolymeric O-antigen transport system ATP-binding protein
MASDVVIRAEGLGKKYVIRHQAEREYYLALRDVIARKAARFTRASLDFVRGRGTSPVSITEEFWALRDVSFEVRRGEVVGVIGRNGAGKSTLLKVLSRITEPSAGRVTIEGRVASLLEVGTGFHPELTGRENIFLNGAILGMTQAEIRRKFDQIVAFAEVERFLDTPVKRYSSGMYVRLAFAVAAHLEPEIIIVDEVLAVGDAEFQKKCLGKMSEIAGAGRTVLFVSHNMASIQALCPRSLFLASGMLIGSGPSEEIVATYLGQRQAPIEGTKSVEIKIQDGLVLEDLQFGSAVIRTGESLDVDIQLRAHGAGHMMECAVLFRSARGGTRVAVVDVRESRALPMRYTKGYLAIKVRIDTLPFVEGVYTVGLLLVTDRFATELSELKDFVVTPARTSFHAPYPAESRGLVALRASSSISLSQQVEIV